MELIALRSHYCDGRVVAAGERYSTDDRTAVELIAAGRASKARPLPAPPPEPEPEPKPKRRPRPKTLDISIDEIDTQDTEVTPDEPS
jgi:hypothetical protein